MATGLGGYRMPRVNPAVRSYGPRHHPVALVLGLLLRGHSLSLTRTLSQSGSGHSNQVVNCRPAALRDATLELSSASMQHSDRSGVMVAVTPVNAHKRPLASEAVPSHIARGAGTLCHMDTFMSHVRIRANVDRKPPPSRCQAVYQLTATPNLYDLRLYPRAAGSDRPHRPAWVDCAVCNLNTPVRLPAHRLGGTDGGHSSVG